MLDYCSGMYYQYACRHACMHHVLKPVSLLQRVNIQMPQSEANSSSLDYEMLGGFLCDPLKTFVWGTSSADH